MARRDPGSTETLDDDPRLADVPKGAFAVAGIAVGLLMLSWLAIYLFVFLPRGTVG